MHTCSRGCEMSWLLPGDSAVLYYVYYVTCVINQARGPGGAARQNGRDAGAEARVAVVWQRCCASRPHSAELWSTQTGESGGALHGQRGLDTVKTFSFTRDLCHFLSTEGPSMHPLQIGGRANGHSVSPHTQKKICHRGISPKQFFSPLTLSLRLGVSSLKSALSAGVFGRRQQRRGGAVGLLFRHPDDASVKQLIGSEEPLVVPHTPGGKSVEVWVIWACWAHYRPPLMDTLKASLDRRGFIKSSAHSDRCCYLCMFVSIRLLSPHFLTQGIRLSLSSHEGSLPALCAALALL